jgi:hypothetical protein
VKPAFFFLFPLTTTLESCLLAQSLDFEQRLTGQSTDMKPLLYCTGGLLLAAATVHATVLFSDDFNSYTAGNLAGLTANAVGQGTWAQTGASAATPVQVNGSGGVSIGASGQDVFAPLPGGSYTLADGSSFYMGVDINMTSVANATGDYFLHWSITLGNTGTFPDRLYAKASGTQYVLGWAGSSGTGVTFGTPLDYGTTYRVVTEYDAVAGPANDAGAIFVNGSSYLALTTMTTGAEPTSPETIAEVCLRQGTSGPIVAIDNLNAATTLAETTTYTAVPEPTTAMLGGLALLGLAVLRRRS